MDAELTVTGSGLDMDLFLTNLVANGVAMISETESSGRMVSMFMELAESVVMRELHQTKLSPLSKLLGMVAISLHHLRPYPKSADMDVSSEEFTRWARENWGCERDVLYGELVSYEPGRVTWHLEFPLIHTPPDVLLQWLSSRYPALTFRFSFRCPDIDWEGTLVAKGGTLTRDVQPLPLKDSHKRKEAVWSC